MSESWDRLFELQLPVDGQWSVQYEGGQSATKQEVVDCENRVVLVQSDCEWTQLKDNSDEQITAGSLLKGVLHEGTLWGGTLWYGSHLKLYQKPQWSPADTTYKDKRATQNHLV